MAIDLTTAKYDIAKIYIAAFNRVPDSGGLEFWSSAYMNGAPLSEIARGFTSSQEYANTYASNLTNSEYVAKIYQNVFARDVDPSGNVFWVDVLNKGAATKAGLLNELVNAAMANGSSDGARLTNQATFGIYCATNNIPHTSVNTQLGSITSDTSSIEMAKNTIGIVITNAVTISSSGSHVDSSSVNTTYTISSGDYTHSINGFGSGDKIVFPTDGVLTLSNTNYADGIVALQCVYGGKTSSISLTGLSVTNDAVLTSTSAFASVFGSSTISGGTGTSTGGTGGGSTPPTTANVSITGAGSNSDSSSVNTTYTVSAGEYTYVITGFSAGDKVDFPSTNAPTVVNSSYADGEVILQFASGGVTTIVKLIGLSATNDISLNSIDNFNTVFGSGTIF